MALVIDAIYEFEDDSVPDAFWFPIASVYDLIAQVTILSILTVHRVGHSHDFGLSNCGGCDMNIRAAIFHAWIDVGFAALALPTSVVVAIRPEWRIIDPVVTIVTTAMGAIGKV